MTIISLLSFRTDLRPKTVASKIGAWSAENERFPYSSKSIFSSRFKINTTIHIEIEAAVGIDVRVE